LLEFVNEAQEAFSGNPHRIHANTPESPKSLSGRAGSANTQALSGCELVLGPRNLSLKRFTHDHLLLD
jgi:hypothetical protein